MRAISADIRASAKVQGASTITMQLAEQLLTQKLDLAARAQQFRLSGSIPRKKAGGISNIINFGHGAYGVQAASEMYFGKSVEDLTLPEAALLAAIPKPLSEPHFLSETAMNRRN